MSQNDSLYGWAIVNWGRASLPIGVLLLLLVPFVWNGVGFEALLVYLLLPVYMLHQYEEHGHGAFKMFVNKMLGGGREVLTDLAIFWINIAGVWIVGLIGLYLSVYVSLAYGLAIAYLVILNGCSHVLMTVVRREYNPGVWTSFVLFLPVGGYTAYAINHATGTRLLPNLLGLGFAILLHAAIIVHVRRRIAEITVTQGIPSTGTRPA